MNPHIKCVMFSLEITLHWYCAWKVWRKPAHRAKAVVLFDRLLVGEARGQA